MSSIEIDFTKGWHQEENTESDPFRWMDKDAVCFIKNSKIPGLKYLKIFVGHPFLEEKNPLLQVFINEKQVGEREIDSSFCFYNFPFQDEGDIKVEFKLDRIFQVPNEPSGRGIMVKSIEVLRPSEIECFLDGWYPEETSPSGNKFQWMKKEGSCLFFDLPKESEKYLRIIGGHSFYGAENPVLTVAVDFEEIVNFEILPGEMIYLIPFDTSNKTIQVDLKLNKVFNSEYTHDYRKLGIFVKSVDIFFPDKDSIAYGEGWYEWDYSDFFPYRWMSKKSRLIVSDECLNESKFISFYLFSEFEDLSQILQLELNGKSISETPVLRNWNYYSIDLQKGIHSQKSIINKSKTESNKGAKRQRKSHELVFSINKCFPESLHQEDPRELGVRISSIEFHKNEETHEGSIYFHSNALLNYKEMSEGKTKLKSFPLTLGIDLYGKCNINPPCVYCLWDSMKVLEGDYAREVVDEKTLKEYGPFFLSARTLVNCSFGEPLLHPRFSEIIDFCSKHKKIIEISTNGQAFNKRTISALVGKPIFLYVSLDAARKETYEKIRNDKWDTIVPNLVLLNQERKKKGNLPKIYMVFMPMKVNIDDIKEYFQLCKRIQADALVLRPLLYLWEPTIEIDRGGYHFSYKNELLNHEQLEEIAHKCREYSKIYNVPIADQFSFGKKKDKRKKKERISLDGPKF